MKITTKTKSFIMSVCAILVVMSLLFTVTSCGDSKTETTSTTEPTIKEVVSSTDKDVTESITEDETSSEVENSTTKESETELITKPVTIPEITKKQDDKPVTTTRQPVTTTSKPVTTTQKTTTTKKPTTTEVEYYPALTKADMEELVRYGASYIESRGYWANPELRWDNAGYMVTTGLRDDLSCYGDEFKIVGGSGYTPLEYAKSDLKGYIDYFIESCETNYGPGYIDCMYPLVRGDADGWEWTIGFWLAGQ